MKEKLRSIDHRAPQIFGINTMYLILLYFWVWKRHNWREYKYRVWKESGEFVIYNMVLTFSLVEWPYPCEAQVWVFLLRETWLCPLDIWHVLSRWLASQKVIPRHKIIWKILKSWLNVSIRDYQTLKNIFWSM